MNGYGSCFKWRFNKTNDDLNPGGVGDPIELMLKVAETVSLEGLANAISSREELDSGLIECSGSVLGACVSFKKPRTHKSRTWPHRYPDQAIMMRPPSYLQGSPTGRRMRKEFTNYKYSNWEGPGHQRGNRWRSGLGYERFGPYNSRHITAFKGYPNDEIEWKLYVIYFSRFYIPDLIRVVVTRVASHRIKHINPSSRGKLIWGCELLKWSMSLLYTKTWQMISPYAAWIAQTSGYNQLGCSVYPVCRERI